MTTLSVPISGDLENFINRMVKDGRAANKADAVRRALREYAENEALETIFRAEREFAQGKVLRGDIRDLMKKFK
jgi:Arc/MetJ-type ribon-helix-helix transcriptional regulator